jgi:CubicO group peptidase (beta-lactamase class C family)
MRVASAGLTIFLVTLTGFPATSQPSEIRARIDAYVTALSSGSPEQFEAMAKDNFTPELLDRTAAQRPTMVARLHDDFGEISIASERISNPTHVEIEMQSRKSSMPLSIVIDFESSAPFRIARTAIRAGGPAGGGRGGRGGPPLLPAAPINGRMSDAELASTLDGYLAGLARASDFAGVVLVAKDGKAIFEKPYGVADRERGTPMATDLRFNIASIGKAFSKTAIGQLVQAGKLKPTDTIGALLPDYPNADGKPATIDQLLHFQVGIADVFGDRFAKEPKERFQSNHDYYAFVAPQPLTFAPGARTQYCNGCYVVLGEIIAKVSGMPYERYIQEHVFAPAGMTSAGYLAFGDARVALGYTRPSPDQPWTSALNMHGHHGSGAGGAYATVRDLLAFDTAVRTHALLDAKMTAWFFNNPADESRPRAMDSYGIAGGAAGANASLESNGVWTIVTLGNLDPPNAVRVGEVLAHALYERESK